MKKSRKSVQVNFSPTCDDWIIVTLYHCSLHQYLTLQLTFQLISMTTSLKWSGHLKPVKAVYFSKRGVVFWIGAPCFFSSFLENITCRSLKLAWVWWYITVNHVHLIQCTLFKSFCTLINNQTTVMLSGQQQNKTWCSLSQSTYVKQDWSPSLSAFKEN